MNLFDVEKMKQQLTEQTEKHVCDGKRWLEQTRDELIQELERRAQIFETTPSVAGLLEKASEIRTLELLPMNWPKPPFTPPPQPPMEVFADLRVNGAGSQQFIAKLPPKKHRVLIVFLPVEE